MDGIEKRLKQRRHALGATYRFQFHGKGFRFRDATERIGYLAELGVSHVYSSPLMKSQSGSNHGYDVVDPTELNDELGSPSDFEQFIATIRQHHLGQLLDIVPNHMSVANDENKWWMDVLKHGPASRYAPFFDIDWQPARGHMQGRVLLPMLDAASGEVLESGRMSVRYCAGAFCLAIDHTSLPLEPQTWNAILVPGIELLGPMSHGELIDNDVIELHSIVAAIRNLPSRSDTSQASVMERFRETLVIENRLNTLVQKSPQIAEHISGNLRSINGTVGEPRSFDQLDGLLESQPYRLVHWKASSDEINYRRFFDVSTLAALSIENMTVFETTHQMFLRLAATGNVDACRVDHVDGLFDPLQYLWRLQWCYLRELGKFEFEQGQFGSEASVTWPSIEPLLLERLHQRFGGRAPQETIQHRQLEQRPVQARTSRLNSNLATDSVDGSSNLSTGSEAGVDSAESSLKWPLPIYVEKILGTDEPLPDDWPVRGTTGYDFMNLLNGLFIEPEGFQHIKQTYDRFIGSPSNFDDIIYECKRLILSGPMQSEVTLLANRLDRIASTSRYSRDFTLNALEFAIQEIIACFSVYRTYIHDGSVSARDEQIVQRATAMAKRRNPAIETNTFDFVRDVLLLKEPHELSDEVWREREFLVGRFQQVTSPVQAKGVEDTAFYRYIPLLSIDEVGGEPRHAIVSSEQFHQQNVKRHSQWPGSMLATTTHDTKRSEDVRARLNVLSEAPGLWRKALQRWHRLNRKHLREVDGHAAPCRNDQWLFYQTLVGIWPASPPSDQERASIIERVLRYMEKATHEAKLHTSWISPNTAYDAAVKQFVQTVLADANSKFSLDLQEFVETILDCGLLNAASQVLLKLTSPGVPDIYQGQELWDFSLVDPDNRRPVDYDLRQHLLREIREATAQSDSRLAFARYLRANPRDNRFKMFVTLESLRFRQQTLGGMRQLTFMPLQILGAAAHHLIAHAWYQTSGAKHECIAIAAAPRFAYKLAHSQLALRASPADEPVVCHIDWSDTRIQLPAPTVSLTNAFTGSTVETATDELPVGELLRDFPMLMLY